MSIMNKSEKKYYIQSRNIHLMNILEKDYYIELGVIDVDILDRIINKEQLEFSKVFDLGLLSGGIGKITGDPINDFYYQLNYLINLRLKNSTCKFFLTAGTVKYFDDDNCEKYAPVILIPFDFDYQHFEIIINGDPIINPLLLKFIISNLEQTKVDSKKVLDYYNSIKITSSSDIDKVIYEIANELDSPVDPSNYLTIVHVEYPDIILEKDFMSIENSVNQMTEQTIFNRYYNEVKAIFPTNTIQKYVILKASEGEKFSVNGRLGSGKTYTILNIIADQIRKDKKILYVNQDADNIYDIEKNFTYLGLKPYTYNLTKNLREIVKQDFVLEDVDTSGVSENIINDIFELPNTLKKRMHGFKIANIYEYLAILKQRYKDIYEIPLETVLESHEAISIYEDLIQIEEALSKIDLYANNIWHKLQVSHNNLTSNDILSRIQTWNTTHNELYAKLLEFVTKYDMKLPANINELYKLISYVYSFSSVRPLNKWINVEVRKNITKYLREIQSLVDTNYNINSYYEGNVSISYKVGRMRQIFNMIVASHLKVDASYNSEDEIYINRLINYKEDLNLLSSDITDNINKLNKINDELASIFNFNILNDDTYNFVVKLEKFLSENRFNSLIYDTYHMSQSIFSKNGDAIYKAYLVYVDKKSCLPKYIKHDELISKDNLDMIMRKKNSDKLLTRLVNSKVVKKANKSINSIIEDIRIYYIALKEVLDNLASIFGNKDFDDDFINQFISFYSFTNDMNIHEKAYFKSFLDKLSREASREKHISKMSLLIKDFLEEEFRTNSLITLLKNYKIIVDDCNIYQKVQQLLTWNEYLKNVNNLKEELKTIYVDKSMVEYTDLVKLMKIDAQFEKVHKSLDEKEAKYKDVLGEYYRGIDTVISEIGRTNEQYDEFLKFLNHPENINSLFVDSKFKSLLEDIKILDRLCATWTNRYRLFSVCFKGSQPETLTNSFEQNKKLFRQFIDRADQINPILTINELTEGFLNYNLKTLHDGIKSCKYGENVSKHFIYSVLLHDYNEANTIYPNLTNLDNYFDKIDDYLLYEASYCQKNLKELIDASEEFISSSSLAIDFNDYNKIIKQKAKNTRLFYADLDIFNSNLDLQQFDLVIIDDVHLSSSNKYHRLTECNQVIVFGDKLFQTSVSNALMKRLGDDCSISYHRRYLNASSKFDNKFDYNNQYIYTYNSKYEQKECDDFDAFIDDVFKRFKEKPKQIINILIANESTRRNIYTAIVSRLSETFNPEEINYILCYNIRILNALTEGNRYVNDVYVYFDDFKDLEESVKNLVFKNFITVHNDVIFYTIKNKLESENIRTASIIQQIIGTESDNYEVNTGIVPYVRQALINKKVNVVNGFGKFDLVLKGATTVGIMLLDKAHSNFTSFIDDYLYYHNEYEKRGWHVEIIYSNQLFQDFDSVINHLVKEVNNNGN